MKLSSKIKIAVSLLSYSIIIILGMAFITLWLSSLRLQLGREALDLAHTIASSPFIQENIVETNGYIKIQNHIEKLRLKTRIHHIYVINKDGILFSHPLSNYIGKKYESTLTLETLKGGTDTIRNEKIFAYATEASTIVYNKGKISGVIVVGLLNGRLYQEFRESFFQIFFLVLFFLIGGNLMAKILSKSIKKTIFGLEPQEIALLLGQKEMVLENLKEGIIAFDCQGEIDLINNSALNLLGISRNEFSSSPYRDKFQRWVDEALGEEPNTPFEVQTTDGRTLLIRFYKINEKKGKIPGVIASIEDLTTVRQRAEELTGMKELTFSLRAQNHEFMNKLHTISGLIQMEEYDQAINYISDTASNRLELLQTLGQRIKDLSLAGLLLAKYNKASEAKILINIDETSHLSTSIDGVESNDLCSIMGNLIENSIDELKKKQDGEIFTAIYEGENFLEIIVEDNGGGIDAELKDRIFEKGISSKGDNRGYGLYIIKELVNKYSGTIELKSKRGLIINVLIPLKRDK